MICDLLFFCNQIVAFDLIYEKPFLALTEEEEEIEMLLENYLQRYSSHFQ